MGVSIWEGSKAQDLLDQMSVQNTVLTRIADKMGAYSTPVTWQGYRELVRRGLAKGEIPVGSQITDTWAEVEGTDYACPWDVVHYDDDGNAYLKWHYGFKTDVAFDAPEAIYYAPSGGLAAGQYYITIATAYGTGWVVDQNINFTLAEDMAEGDQLVISTGTNNDVNPTNGRTWNVYAKGSTTSKDTGTTSNSDTGTKLGETSSDGSGYTNGNINAPARIVYGYNRWSQSAVRQYLNGIGAAGEWWTAQNPWDRPPAQHTAVRGFLAGCTEGFLEVLEPTEVVTARNTAEGATETTETTLDKIFLPSLQEMYISPQLANVEGVNWDYYKELAQAAGLPGKFSQGSTYPILKTYRISDPTSAVSARLRSAYRSSAYDAWRVYASGGVYNRTAFSASSGVPACKIKKS